MKKTMTGYVISNKNEKTVVVRVERKYRHPLYRKVVKSHKKYMTHCDDPSVQVGDQVAIQSTRPISKQKHFIVVGKVS